MGAALQGVTGGAVQVGGVEPRPYAGQGMRCGGRTVCHTSVRTGSQGQFFCGGAVRGRAAGCGHPALRITRSTCGRGVGDAAPYGGKARGAADDERDDVGIAPYGGCGGRSCFLEGKTQKQNICFKILIYIFYKCGTIIRYHATKQ